MNQSVDYIDIVVGGDGCDGGTAMANPPLGRPVGASGAETRQRIITAAMRCVAQLGYSRTTIREIARAAGITSANLYNYFPNKSELVKATIAARADIALPRLHDAADQAATVVERILAVLDESARLMREYPDLAAFERAIRTQSGIVLYPGETGDVGFHGGFQALREIINGIVNDARRQGVLGVERDPPAVAEVLYALVHGLTELAATEPPATYQAALGAAKQLIRGTLFRPGG